MMQEEVMLASRPVAEDIGNALANVEARAQQHAGMENRLNAFRSSTLIFSLKQVLKTTSPKIELAKRSLPQHN
ncbi:hypothetical protein PPTG_24633 [Phytophthora nicotianae INRA-310]|uniref:Uncharacterized protein n=1 Tax=Phytophthora nicotianae (strain INRA-310) TaxID=761204 RepID=W2PCK9_PHYN3|nr:hypothetical protein PPTG_24633 [Phytophthora nicotianae INRA-310]ETM98380.1 hypothetical protein PPTG_24633 [Phytophthora nicotianae INRA-310]